MINQVTRNLLNNSDITPDALGVFMYILIVGKSRLPEYMLIHHFKHYSIYDLRRALLELEKYHYIITKVHKKHVWIILRNNLERNTIDSNDSINHTINNDMLKKPLEVKRANKKTLINRNRLWLSKQKQSSNFDKIYLKYVICFQQLPPASKQESNYYIKWVNIWLRKYNVSYICSEITKIYESIQHNHRNIEHPFEYIGKSLDNDNLNQSKNISASSNGDHQEHTTHFGKMFSNIIKKHEV